MVGSKQAVAVIRDVDGDLGRMRQPQTFRISELLELGGSVLDLIRIPWQQVPDNLLIENRVIFAIDAPLGFPIAFRQLLAGQLPDNVHVRREVDRRFAYRETERWICETFAKKPLSTPFDKLGNNATVAMYHAAHRASTEGFQIVTFHADNGGDVMIEVYPALVKDPATGICAPRIARLLPSGLPDRSDQQDAAISALHAMAYALQGGCNGLPRNAADGATPPKPQRAEMKPLTAHEVAVFLASTENHREHSLYVLAVRTGMRSGELHGLKWSTLILTVECFEVEYALQSQRGGALVFVPPKTSRSRLIVHLSQAAIAALRRQKARQNEERLQVGSEWSDGDLVLANHFGIPMKPSATTRRFQTALRAAGLEERRFHDLRRTAATLLLRQNVHPKVISELLGHSTIATTMDTYSHFVPALHLEAASAMDKVLAGFGQVSESAHLDLVGVKAWWIQ